MSSRSGLVAVAVALMMASGCAGSPERGRPIPLGPVESGPNSLESVRRLFEGQWDLVSAEIVRRDRTARRHQGQGPADLRRLRQPDRRRAIRRRTGAEGRVHRQACSRTRDAPSSTWSRHASCCRTCRSGPSRARTLPTGCRRPTSATTRSTAISLTLTIKDAAGKTTAKTAWRRIGSASPAATASASAVPD